MQINVCHLSGAVFYSDTQNKTPRIFTIGVQFQSVAASCAVFHSVLRAFCAVFHSDSQNKTPRQMPATPWSLDPYRERNIIFKHQGNMIIQLKEI